MDSTLMSSWPDGPSCLGIGGRSDEEKRRVPGWASVRSPVPRKGDFGLSVLLLGCCSVCSRGRERSFRRASCSRGEGCESGCLCALAPHGAGDCLPRHDPQANRSFPPRGQSGWLLEGRSKWHLRPSGADRLPRENCQARKLDAVIQHREEASALVSVH
jgi:hypothetical protein